MSTRFSIHFDGPIARNHKVSLRVLSRTYEHMQRSIDRAYLDTKYGGVWKHARLKKEDYEHTEFIAEYPREGGIILDAIKDGANAIIDRLNGAISGPFEQALHQGIEEHHSIVEQLVSRKRDAHSQRQHLQTYQEMLDHPDAKIVRAFSDRSIIKEIDQIASLIRPEELDGSYLEINLSGTSSYPTYTFDALQAKRFHDVISHRELGKPVLTRVKIRLLDQGNKYGGMKAKVTNLESQRELILHLESEDDFRKLHPYHLHDQVMIFACPVIEYGAYDPNGGDMYFIDIAE